MQESQVMKKPHKSVLGDVDDAQYTMSVQSKSIETLKCE